MELLIQIWNLMLLLAPWLLLGMGIAGILHVFLPEGFVRKHLGGNRTRDVFKAVAFGVPMPLCSCGVIPAAIGLKKDGASDGASVGFLIATPQTGVDSILVSATFLGWPFAIFKVISALVSGMAGGILVNWLGPNGKTDAQLSVDPPSCCSGHQESKPAKSVPDEEGCCCAGEPKKTVEARSSCCGSSDNDKNQEESSCCGNNKSADGDRTLIGQVTEVFRFAFAVLLKDIYRWLIIGIVAAAMISTWIPAGKLSEIAWSQGLWGMLLMLVVSLPMYICATASVPLAASLVLAGMSPGSALVLLMAGPTSNAATMGAIYRAFGGRLLAIYLLTVAVMSIGMGMLFDQVVQVQAQELMQHHESHWIQVVCAVILAAVLSSYAIVDIKKWLAPRPSSGCCGH